MQAWFILAQGYLTSAHKKALIYRAVLAFFGLRDVSSTSRAHTITTKGMGCLIQGVIYPLRSGLSEMAQVNGGFDQLRSHWLPVYLRPTSCSRGLSLQ